VSSRDLDAITSKRDGRFCDVNVKFAAFSAIVQTSRWWHCDVKVTIHFTASHRLYGDHYENQTNCAHELIRFGVFKCLQLAIKHNN
jgi:hypothetical protein